MLNYWANRPANEAALVLSMRNRVYDAFKGYREDIFYTNQIPTNSVAQVEYLIKKYRSVFPLKL